MAKFLHGSNFSVIKLIRADEITYLENSRIRTTLNIVITSSNHKQRFIFLTLKPLKNGYY